jgi:sterol desaturase/sphingolipid hydroxylase (fatty acid hydroxylase superfamily)
MRLLRSPAAAAVTGALTWTVTEYGLHRFAMHALGGRGLASREHLSHHADVTYFSPASKKIASAAATSAVAWPAVAAAAGRRSATAFTVGMIATYFGYEVAHRRIHTHPPANRYGRWARRHHLRHHFGAPMRNFGVTSPVWDRAFGTVDDGDVLKVPQRMAPVWLVDDHGAVRPEFAADYTVVPRRDRSLATTERDRTDAFANVAPAL